MKTDDLLLAACALLALYVVTRPPTNAASGSIAEARRTGANTGVSEIFDVGGQPFSNGWHYYTDGRSVSPDGSLYQGGTMIYKGLL